MNEFVNAYEVEKGVIGCTVLWVSICRRIKFRVDKEAFLKNKKCDVKILRDFSFKEANIPIAQCCYS